MAYGKIYTLPFYDRLGNAVIVDLYKQDYVDSVSSLRCTKLEKYTNYKGAYSPIITSFIEIEIANESVFTTFDNLLSAYEREYKAIVTYKSTIVFEGYLNCEDVEQTFLEHSIVRLTFNDGLKRLEDESPTIVNTFDTVSLLDYIQSCLSLTAWAYDIHINSRLFYTPYHSETATDTMFEQSAVDTDLFWKNDSETDNAYDILTKILKPLNAFIYIFEEKFIIERYDDIDDSISGWVIFEIDGSEASGSAGSNLYASKNKQTDFNYEAPSQRIEYQKAVNTLKVILNDEQYLSKVYNDFTVPLTEFAGTYPVAADLVYKDWTAHEDLNTVLASQNGVFDIGPHLSYDRNLQETTGLYYKFKFSFNEDGDTVLRLEWKVYAPPGAVSLAYDQLKFYVRFFIRKGEEGIADDFYLYPDETNEDKMAYFNTVQIWEEGFDSGGIENDTITLSKSLTITDLKSLAGPNDDQDYIIGFLPTGYRIASDTGVIDGNELRYLSALQIIGDFKISVHGDSLDNDLEYTLQEDFVRKEEVDIDIFSAKNLNFKNGIYFSSAGQWGRAGDGSGSAYGWGDGLDSLEDVFTKSIYQVLARNLKKLVATIIIDEHLKPLTILTDDNLEEDSDTLIPFILVQDRWNVAECTHRIEALEYVQETINLIE